MSSYTKKYKSKLWICRILNFLILFAPVIVYVFIALADEGVTSVAKVSVVASISVSFIICLVNAVAQKKLRCPLWILLLGLFIAVRDSLMPLIVMVSVATILDDFVFSPLIKFYHEKYVANIAIDERLNANE